MMASARQRSDSLAGIGMVAPAVVLVATVYLYPAVVTLLYSFARIDPADFSFERFVGLQNFSRLLRDDAVQGVIWRTIYFGVAVMVLTIAISFLIAMLLNQSFRGRGLLRVVVLLPWAVPPVVSGVLWGQMFNAEYGFVNGLIRVFGGEGNIIWLGEPALALHAVIVAEVWRWIPFATLFLLGGLQTIPPSLWEAASVDGATRWQRFRLVTLPLMWPITLPVMLFLFVWSMKAFDTIFVLTRGGPQMGTTTLNFLVYQQGFQEFRFSLASATAYVLMLLTLAMVALLMLLRRLATRRMGEG